MSKSLSDFGNLLITLCVPLVLFFDSLRVPLVYLGHGTLVGVVAFQMEWNGTAIVPVV